jgi:hypothetical protein
VLTTFQENNDVVCRGGSAMKYYHVAPDSEANAIFSGGIEARDGREIPIIALHESFLMSKFIFDVYAHEILDVDVYCAFEVDRDSLESALFDSSISHVFSSIFKVVYQQKIPRKYLKPFQTDQSFEGMGLIEGVLPVENRDKFTKEYKQKIQEYIEELGE